MDEAFSSIVAPKIPSEDDLRGCIIVIDEMKKKTKELESSADKFSQTIARAFVNGAAQGKQFDDILKSIALRMSDTVLRQALSPVTKGIGDGLSSLITGLFGGAKPFAAGGVINTPSYFPLPGGLGLAGEAGPEAILPLARGSDGRLGIAAGGGGAAHVTVNIATPDADSFRRSESYVTGQIARAVARGQRSL